MTYRKKAAIAGVVMLGLAATAAAFTYLNKTRECDPDAAILEKLREGGCDIPTTSLICEKIPDIAFATAKCGQELLTKALLAGYQAGKSSADLVSTAAAALFAGSAAVAGIFAAKYSCKSDRAQAFVDGLHEDGDPEAGYTALQPLPGSARRG